MELTTVKEIYRNREQYLDKEITVCSIIDFETQSLRIVGRHYNL